MAGFGRTGKWFAVDNWGIVVPDILTVAKGINSGYVAARSNGRGGEPIADWIRSRYFRGADSPTAAIRSRGACGGVASIEAFQEEGIVEQAAASGRTCFRAEAERKLAARQPVCR